MEWVILDMAIMGIGCITAPVYPSNTEEQVKYIVKHSESKVVFAEDQEQLDKMLVIWKDLPLVKKVVVIDKYYPRDLPNVITLNDYREFGKTHRSNNPGKFEERLASVEPEDIISFTYTSGTTGYPKAGMFNSHNVISVAKNLPDMLPTDRSDLGISYLPLSHIAERLLGHFIKLYSGYVTVFADSMEDMPYNLRQTGPTIMFGTPRVFEKFYARISIAMKDATLLQKTIYDWALKVGKKYTELKDKGLQPSLLLKFNRLLAHFLVYRKIKDMFGGNIRFLLSGAAPISPNIIRYFHWVGLDIYEGYGMTETTGIVTGNKIGEAKIGSVGQALPGTEIRIAEDGEICTRCPQNISGYYKNEDATRELLIPDEKGNIWLHTGDIGHLDEEGYLFITDRKKDIIITAGGKNVAPQNIENLLKTSPYISLAMVYGDKKPYLTALVTLDEDEIVKFARDKKIMYQDLADLSKKQEVLDLLHHEISVLNLDLASYETVKKFRILEEELDQDKDEVTPTLKVKRKVVIDHYQDLIDNMYA
jgi:long-chain acyl-CoA synthetase